MSNEIRALEEVTKQLERLLVFLEKVQVTGFTEARELVTSVDFVHDLWKQTQSHHDTLKKEFENVTGKAKAVSEGQN